MINIDRLNIISADNIQAHIPTTSKNIIFWDTCAILDILNFVGEMRDATFIKTVKKINDLIENGNTISFASNISIQEINDNYPEPYGNAEKFLKNTIIDYNKVLKYVNELLGTDYEETEDRPLNFIPTLELIIQNLLNKTHFILDDTFLKVARDRLVNKIAPSAKNNGFKDSVIWETCIDVSRKITNNQNIYFISSNHKDFGKNGEFDEVKNDCNNYSIKFKNKVYELYTIN